MEETSDSEQKQWARNKKQTTAAHVAVPGGSPTFPRDQDNPLGSSFGAPQQPLTPQSSSGVYDVVKPTRMKSVLITNQTAKYKPVADDITSAAGHDVVPVCSPTDVIPTRSGKTPDVDVTTNTTFVKKLRYEHNEEPIQANDPIRNYSFVIRDEDDDDDDGQSQRAEATPHTTSHEPITDSSSAEIRRETTIASGSAADNSFAERLKRSFAAAGMKHPFPSHEPFETQNPYLVVNDTDRGFDYPMAENVPCVSESKLRDDGVPFTTYFIVLRSEACWRSLLFALRVTLISLLPTFVLTEHENTKSFFAAATLVPVVAVLFVKLPCLLGEQIFLFILGCQCVVAVLVVGVFSRAVGTRYNTSAFWCCVVFGCFGFSLLGDLASKRMMMMYSIIIQQMLIQTGDSYSFTLRFVRDLTFAFMFALAAVALPFPNLCSRKAKESVLGIHKLVAAGVGNCVKAYFAPVGVDAEVALSQVPFEKIRNAVAGFKPLFLFCKYEPFEFNHNNFLRMERVQQIESVKAYLYTMAAAARKRLDTGHASRHGLRPEMREFVRGLEKPVQALAEEIMRTVVELGAHVEPEAVLEKVHYDALYERTIMLSDFVHEERCKMLLLKHLTEEETNFCLTTFTFARSLLDVAYLIEKIEQGARNYDPTKYPTLARRAFNFFFYDTWSDFWSELPKRLTLATDRDVRLWKDGIRYSLGFAVACAFTMNYDKENVYFFGMAILIRISQQTASETLQIGAQRLAGLILGVSLAKVVVDNTHNLAEKTALTCCFDFILLALSHYEPYFQAVQYAIVTSITTQKYFATPEMLVQRLADNVFAFIFYVFICIFLFPVDPLRILWNTRTKAFINLNAIMQNFVALSCARVTKTGEEVKFLLADVQRLKRETDGLLTAYGGWMQKCIDQPKVRGGVYPAGEIGQVLLRLKEIAGLHETLIDAFVTLHRPRDNYPDMLLIDTLELLRPFVADVGKLFQAFMQEMVYSTERPKDWTVQKSVVILWKAQLACRSFFHVTGNIQRNYFAATQQVSGADRKAVNLYLDSSVMQEALQNGVDPAELRDPKNADLIQRLFTLSYQMNSPFTMQNREDLRAINVIMSIFEIELKTLKQLLFPMIKIHEYEFSRTTV